MRTAIAIVSAAVLSASAAAQTNLPGTLPPAPPVVVMPPAPPPAPVPSVVAPSPPLPGVTFQNPARVPGGGYVTPSYRLKAKPPAKKRCKPRPGRRCRTS
jgi:hypothetical protein